MSKKNGLIKNLIKLFNRHSRNYYQRALQLAQEVGNRRGESLVLGNLGWLSNLLGDFKTAVSHFEQQRVIAENIRDLYQQTFVAINLSMALLAQGNPEDALALLERTFPVLDETLFFWTRIRAEKLHLAVLKALGRDPAYSRAKLAEMLGVIEAGLGDAPLQEEFQVFSSRMKAL